MSRMREQEPREHQARDAVASRECQVLIVRGKTACRVGKRAEARYYFRAALEIVPDHPTALLWLAYLAGGGRPSLEYLVRLLETDPTSQKARAAIRWARARGTPRAATSISPPQVRPSHRGRYSRSVLMGLAVVLLGLAGGLATLAFMLDTPTAIPTRAIPIARLVSATPVPLASATPTELPSPTFPPPSPTETPGTAPTGAGSARSAAMQTHEPRVVSAPVPGSSSARGAQAAELLRTPATGGGASAATPTLLPGRSFTSGRSAAAIEPSPAPATTSEGNPEGPTLTSGSTVVLTPLPTANIGDDFRWIDVDLSDQRLVAYEGETSVYTVTVSTGLPRTPTVVGRYKIYVKYRAADMRGPDYYLPKVPYVMYFHRGYGLHGTYWHNSFGRPMSHGCVNLPTPDAEWVFGWASVGTPVVVHP